MVSVDVNRSQELCESRGGHPGPPSLISLMVSVDVNRSQELCESRGGHPGPPSLISLMVSVDVNRSQELCESRGGHPGPPSLISLMVSVDVNRSQELCESRGGVEVDVLAPVPNKPMDVKQHSTNSGERLSRPRVFTHWVTRPDARCRAR